MSYKFPDELEAENAAKAAAAAAENNDFEIEVIDDTPAQDKNRKPLDKEVADPTEDEIENYSEGVKKRIQELTHARHDERRAKEQIQREREELERMAQNLLNENNKLKQYVNNGTQEYATTLKAAAESQMEMARRNYKVAQDAFDTEAIIAAQEAMTDAKLKLESAKNFRPSTLQTEETPVKQQYQAPQQVQPDEKTLRWQAQNQWFGAKGFEEHTSFALGLHQKLVNSGIDPQSDEYFSTINGRVKSTFPDLFGEEARQTTTPAKKSASVVAPAARSTGTRKIQLTQTQVALAKKFGLTNQQYALEVLKAEK
jgi:hypothetical protein